LKLSRNPYILEDEEYFTKRRENNIYAKFRAAIYKKYKHLCPICGESLHNGEKVELHHVIPRKNGGKYSMENIQPLHQICHQKVTYKEREISNNRNLKFLLKKKNSKIDLNIINPSSTKQK
jgi:Restriction endonuclease